MRLDTIHQILASIAGQPVDVTFRDRRAFTFSVERRDEAAADRLAAFARSARPDATVTFAHDDEAGSHVYVDVPEDGAPATTATLK